MTFLPRPPRGKSAHGREEERTPVSLRPATDCRGLARSALPTLAHLAVWQKPRHALLAPSFARLRKRRALVAERIVADLTLDTALDAGYEHLDTARRYGNESDIGKAISIAGVRREDIFLTSKVWWTDLEPNKVLTSISQSIEDLGTEYLDLALIHWPNPAVNLAETLDAFAQAKAKGWVRNIGVSNFPSALLKEALDLSLTPIAALQCE